jgi:hypothetical protein
MEWILEKQVADWIHLAQDRSQWWAIVDTVINVLCLKGGEFLD